MFIKSLYKRIRYTSLHLRIVIICVCVMCISMLIVGIYLSSVMYKKSYDGAYEKMQIYTEKTVQNIDQSFSFIANTAMAVSTCQTIGSWIDDNSMLDSEKPEYYSNINQLKDEVKHVLTYSNAWKSDYISFISIFVNGRLVLNTYSKPIPESIMERSAIMGYQYVSKEPGNFILGPDSERDDRNIYYIRTMKRDFSSDNELSVMVAMDEQVIWEQYMSAQPSDEMQVYLINEEGSVFSSNVKEEERFSGGELLLAAQSGESDSAAFEDDYICFSLPLTSNQLTMVTLVQKSYIMGEAFQEFPRFIATVLLLCLLLMTAGFLVSFRSTRFINDLVNAMKQVKQENYDIQMPHYHDAAVNVLSDSFNDMTRAMKTLINDTYESKIMLQEMELEFLQQQMNPHFLFNILATIQIKAKMAEDETLYEMLKSLSGLLRASLYSDRNVFTTLSEEMKYVQFYLYLQKQRYQAKLDYEINIPEEVQNTRIPRLTIEPIVENSVVHGMEDGTYKVKITVRAYREEDDVVICIEDDGAGFVVDFIEQEQNKASKRESREKIGLQNTSSRLKMLYGDKYALVIRSAPGHGTTVIVRIPVKQENENKGSEGKYVQSDHSR